MAGKYPEIELIRLINLIRTKMGRRPFPDGFFNNPPIEAWERLLVVDHSEYMGRKCTLDEAWQHWVIEGHGYPVTEEAALATRNKKAHAVPDNEELPHLATFTVAEYARELNIPPQVARRRMRRTEVPASLQVEGKKHTFIDTPRARRFVRISLRID